MNLVSAINELYQTGRVEYRPMGGQLGCNDILVNMDMSVVLPNWTDMSDMQLKKAVKSFYEEHADYFADGFWLVMYEESGSLIMEVCDEA